MRSSKNTYGLLTHLSRSGSTLLARMLDDFDRVCVTTEAELPLELFGVKSYSPIEFRSADDTTHFIDNVLAKTRVTSWELSSKIILEKCENLGYPVSGSDFVRILLSVYGEKFKPEATHIIYKACPFMPWHIPEAAQHFSDTKFIHLLRDPRAVFHSQFKSIDPFTGKPFSKSALKTALDWKKAAELMSQVQLPNVAEIIYEDLILKPDKTLVKLLEFLEISDRTRSGSRTPFASRMEDADQDLHQDITLPPDPERMFAWKRHLSQRQLFYIDTFLGDLLHQKGYEPSPNKAGSTILIKIGYHLSLNSQGIFCMGRRMRRVVHNIWANPLHLFRRARLKLGHD